MPSIRCVIFNINLLNTLCYGFQKPNLKCERGCFKLFVDHNDRFTLHFTAYENVNLYYQHITQNETMGIDDQLKAKS